MENATQIFLESGLLGAAVVVLAGVIVYMQRKNDTLQKEIVATQAAQHPPAIIKTDSKYKKRQ